MESCRPAVEDGAGPGPRRRVLRGRNRQDAAAVAISDWGLGDYCHGRIRPGSWSGEPRAGRSARRADAERGRTALALKGFLSPSGAEAAYRNAGKLWGDGQPDPERARTPTPAPSGTVTACTRPPIPMTACRWACGGATARRAKTGLQIDCMACHGGSIGGQSYVGLGNTQLDLKAVLFELTNADGRAPAADDFRAQPRAAP